MKCTAIEEEWKSICGNIWSFGIYVDVRDVCCVLLSVKWDEKRVDEMMALAPHLGSCAKLLHPTTSKSLWEMHVLFDRLLKYVRSYVRHTVTRCKGKRFERPTTTYCLQHHICLPFPPKRNPPCLQRNENQILCWRTLPLKSCHFYLGQRNRTTQATTVVSYWAYSFCCYRRPVHSARDYTCDAAKIRDLLLATVVTNKNMAISLIIGD